VADTEQTGFAPESNFGRVRDMLIGPAKDFRDPGARHKLALVALLAWIGLGADGLSSSAYGPEEAFRALGEHSYLAIFLVVATALTIFVISYAYTQVIAEFPLGGGGYIVSTKLLGRYPGLASGCALLVDYVLTITVSIASGGDAVFSLLPLSWQPYKLPAEFAAIVALTIMNLRGVKESVTILAPVFLAFILTHAILILGGLGMHLGDVPAVWQETRTGFAQGAAQLGLWGLFLLFVRAYSLGAGTFTGIEAVSNGLPILREPKVATGRRTMLYMAVSLATTAGGLLLCYMLFRVQPAEGQTLNAVLAHEFAGGWAPGGMPLGRLFVVVTIAAEAVLLLVAAQTGFIDGPRVMGNMALDSWLPRRFGSLSDRLTMQNGILLMGGAAALMLFYARGHIGLLVVMYSINVFLTFTLTEAGMVRLGWRRRRLGGRWLSKIWIQAVGLVLCASILTVMVTEKFREGGWLTLGLTATVFALCVATRAHYNKVTRLVRDLDRQFDKLPQMLKPPASPPAFDPGKPTAIVLVGGYGGLGIHIFFSNMRLFPNTFHNFVFVSGGTVDSEFFKDAEHVASVEQQTRTMLQRYVDLAAQAGRPARYAFDVGTDVAETASDICLRLHREYPQSVVFAGTLVFERPHWSDRLLHNETAYAIQRRLKYGGVPMVILPLLIRTPARERGAVAGERQS
jgi:amino acid transporter